MPAPTLDNKEYPDSSLIQKIEFDDLKETLLIHFKSGELYEYCGINESTWNEIKEHNGSIGKYFHSNIKPNFEFLKKDAKQ